MICCLSISVHSKFLFQLEDVPRHFGRLTTEFRQSGSLFLGGPDLSIPDVHSVAGQIYCGSAYLGVLVDPGEGTFIYVCFVTMFIVTIGQRNHVVN